MKNFIQPGVNLAVIAPYDVTSGQGLLDGAEFSVASTDIKSGASGIGVTEGVFQLPTAAVAITRKTVAYWDNGARLVTNTVGGGTNLKIGIFQTSAAASAGAAVKLIPAI